MKEKLVVEIGKLLRQANFMVALVVLLLAAFTLNAATGFLKLYFKKQPIEPTNPIESIPLLLKDPVSGTLIENDHWLCVSLDAALPADLAEQLGTERFIFRDYLDVSQTDMKTEAETKLKPMAAKERKGAIEMLRCPRPGQPTPVVNLAVTYYTGKADTVAHIPERCYTADGYEPTESPATLTWFRNTPKHPDGIDVRFISFEDQTSRSRTVKRNVAYFFHCNGRYLSDATSVRIALQNLWERYGYYMKIEMMTEGDDAEEAKRAMKEFLEKMLPEIEKTFPPWDAVHQRRGK